MHGDEVAERGWGATLRSVVIAPVWVEGGGAAGPSLPRPALVVLHGLPNVEEELAPLRM